MSSYAARLDIALADMIDRPTKGLDELLDEISAACLDSTTLIQDILGPRANLSEALIALAELSTGKLKMAANPDPVMEQLNRQNGREKGREKVFQDVELPVVAVALKKKKTK